MIDNEKIAYLIYLLNPLFSVKDFEILRVEVENHIIESMGFEIIIPCINHEYFNPDIFKKCQRLLVYRRDNKTVIREKSIIDCIKEKDVPYNNFLYIWECPSCRKYALKCEYPDDSEENGYYGCRCPGTTWGVPIL